MDGLCLYILNNGPIVAIKTASNEKISINPTEDGSSAKNTRLGLIPAMNEEFILAINK